MEVLLRTCCGSIRFFDLYGLFNTNNQSDPEGELRLDLVMTLAGADFENHGALSSLDMVSYRAASRAVHDSAFPILVHLDEGAS